jgi:hypothetical protein
MTRVIASRWLDRIGLTLLGVALLFGVGQGVFAKTSEPAGLAAGIAGAGAALFVYVCFWLSAAIGALALSGRLLLRLQWKYSWIGFFAMGLFLVIQGPVLVGPSYVSIGNDLLFSHWDFTVVLVGIASILMGFIFLVVERSVRRTPGASS